MARRLIVPRAILTPGEHALPPDLAHYLRDVLRLREGAPLSLTDGAGQLANAVVRSVGKKSAVITVQDVALAPPPPGPKITLFQGVGKGEKLDAVVKQATELGARRIVPVLSTRAVAEKSGRAERWRSIAEDAIRVGGRAWLPEISPVTPLPVVLAERRAELSLCGDGTAKISLREAFKPAAEVELLIGPEGGWDGEEREAIERAGFLLVHLGPHTLRTETAGPAAVAIVAFALGAFDARY